MYSLGGLGMQKFPKSPAPAPNVPDLTEAIATLTPTGKKKVPVAAIVGIVIGALAATGGVVYAFRRPSI